MRTPLSVSAVSLQAPPPAAGYRLHIIGHSLGGGTAALLAMMLKEAGGPFAGVRCVAIACPSCMTLELAQSCGGYVTSVMHGADVVPTICPATADALREEVMRRWARVAAGGAWLGAGGGHERWGRRRGCPGRAGAGAGAVRVQRGA